MRRGTAPSPHARTAGFSLVELMIVTAIIGVLATIAVQKMTDILLRIKFKAQLTSILHSLEVVRGASESSPYLGVVTGNWCTACSCTDSCRNVDFKSPSCEFCRTLSDDTWRKLGFPSTPMSAFGTPYLMDENEFENSDCSRRDLLTVARDDGGVDYKLLLPRATCPDTMKLNLENIVGHLASRDGNQALNDWPPPP
jgi:prepilin-type N-terminal cleavage/methylation domain-containing protein